MLGNDNSIGTIARSHFKSSLKYTINSKKDTQKPRKISKTSYWSLVTDQLNLICGGSYRFEYVRDCGIGLRQNKSIEEDLHNAIQTVQAELIKNGQTVVPNVKRNTDIILSK